MAPTAAIPRIAHIVPADLPHNSLVCMTPSSLVHDGEIIISADASVFPIEVVLKTLYWFGDKFQTSVLSEGTTHRITLRLAAKGSLKEEELGHYLQKFQRDLIDNSLRDRINLQTGSIRDLLVAKAFSTGEFDDAPPGNASDPIGFDPLSVRP